MPHLITLKRVFLRSNRHMWLGKQVKNDKPTKRIKTICTTMFSMNTTDRLSGTTHEHTLSKASCTSSYPKCRAPLLKLLLRNKDIWHCSEQISPLLYKDRLKNKAYFFDLRKYYNLPRANVKRSFRERWRDSSKVNGTTALPKVQSSIPSIHMVAHIHL